jgi:hypothetical protein
LSADGFRSDAARDIADAGETIAGAGDFSAMAGIIAFVEAGR